MGEKLAIIMFFIFCFLCFWIVGRVEQKSKEQDIKTAEIEQKQENILRKVEELEKKTRLNSQDVLYLEQIMLEECKK